LIDEDEAAGLRAFALEVGAYAVGAYAGASYPERPEWVTIGGARVAVDAVLASWQEEERRGFRVRLADASTLLLYYVPELDLWSGIQFAPAQARVPGREDEG